MSATELSADAASLLLQIKNSTRSMIRSLVGTVNWQAPELWVPHPRYNEKVDVYSVGLVFWETLQWHQPVKRYPFEGLNEHVSQDETCFCGQAADGELFPGYLRPSRAQEDPTLDSVHAPGLGRRSSRPRLGDVGSGSSF